MISIKKDFYIPLYTYSTEGEAIWQTGQCFETEAEAIAYGMSVTGVIHLKIVKVPDLLWQIAPDTLKTLSGTTGGILDYGQDSNTKQHQSECDHPEPDAEDS